MPLSEIRELKATYWFGLGAPLTSEDIAEHAKLIHEADISYPIILGPEGRVTDGTHRVCRAFLESRETVPAVRFAELHELDHVGKQPDKLPYRAMNFGASRSMISENHSMLRISIETFGHLCGQ